MKRPPQSMMHHAALRLRGHDDSDSVSGWERWDKMGGPEAATEVRRRDGVVATGLESRAGEVMKAKCLDPLVALDKR